ENDANENRPGDAGAANNPAVTAEVPRAASRPAARFQSAPTEINGNDIRNVKPDRADGCDDGIGSATQARKECRARRNPDGNRRRAVASHSRQEAGLRRAAVARERVKGPRNGGNRRKPAEPHRRYGESRRGASRRRAERLSKNGDDRRNFVAARVCRPERRRDVVDREGEGEK